MLKPMMDMFDLTEEEKVIKMIKLSIKNYYRDKNVWCMQLCVDLCKGRLRSMYTKIFVKAFINLCKGRHRFM